MLENDERDIAAETDAVLSNDETVGTDEEPVFEVFVEDDVLASDEVVAGIEPVVDAEEIEAIVVEGDDIADIDAVLTSDALDEDAPSAKPLPWLPMLLALLALAALAGGLYFGLQRFGGGEYGDAARVNGQSITIARLNAEVDRVALAQPGIFDVENGGIDRNMVRSQILDDLINQELLVQKANEEGITVTDEDIQEKLDELKMQFGDQYESTLEEYGYTEQDLSDQIKYSLLIEGLIAQLAPKDSITDAMAKEYYEENSAMFTQAAGKRVSHILFDAEDKALAEAVLEQLQSGEGDFAALAEEHSKDPGSSSTGGDLNWAATDAYVPEFKEAVESMDKGEISELVQTEYGWHIIKITDTREEGVTDFDEVKDDIIDMLHGQKQNDMYQSLMTTLREDADIDILDPDVLAYREGVEDPVDMLLDGEMDQDLE